MAFVVGALFGGDTTAQSVLWNRLAAGTATQPATLGDGRIVTRSMAVDGAGNVVLTGSIANGANRDLLTTRLGAADGAVSWQKTFAGSAGLDDEGLSVAVDSQGNAIVVGVAGNTSGTDIKVIKYAASNGAVVWERTLDWGLQDLGYFVAVDGAGNAIVAGESSNAAGNSDVRVLKLASGNGSTLWQQLEDTGRDDFVSDLAADSAGDIVLLGVSRNAAGNDDIRVVKYASTGARRWQQLFDFGGADAAFSLALDAAGNPAIAGVSIGANANYRALKLDAATGAIRWQRSYDGGRNDHAQAVAVDSGGNVLVTGYSENAAGRYTFKTLKYAASDGASLWEATFDGGVRDFAYQIAVDSADNAVVVGSSANSAGNTDWKAIVYAAANGAVLMQHTHAGGGAQNDDAYAVAAPAGAVIVAGLSVEAGGASAVRAIKLAGPGTTGAISGSNVALASAGAVASASSTYGTWAALRTIDNERAGGNWAGGGGGWVDNTGSAYPDWLQVNFSGTKTIDRVVVYTLQDNYPSPGEPTDAMTFSAYGVRDFSVQGWNGSSWVTLGTVTGNNLVKRTVTFGAFTTDRLRIHVTSGAGGYSRITEVEAWAR